MLRATSELSPPEAMAIVARPRGRVVAGQADLAGGRGLLLLLGSRAHAFPAGLEAAVRRAVDAR